MKLNFLNFMTLSTLALGTSAFAAGTFSCEGKGVKITGTYGSVGASLNSVEIKDVGQAKQANLADKASAYLTQNKLLADAFLGDDHVVNVELDTVGASAENESEPWVYGGIVKTTVYSEVDGKEVKLSKAVPVACSASF